MHLITFHAVGRRGPRADTFSPALRGSGAAAAAATAAASTRLREPFSFSGLRRVNERDDKHAAR